MSDFKSRRSFLKSAALVGAGVSLGSKAIAGEGVLSKDWAKKAKYKWKMVTTWPKNFPGLGTGANLLAKRIAEMSEGAIHIRVYGAGELVPPMGVFDSVRSGAAQMGHSAAYYWQGKHDAASFFAAVPFGLNAQEMNSWLSYGGGQQLWDEVYAPFGLKAFSAGNSGVQMGGWFNKEIKTVQDFKGLKMRMPGLGGKVLSQLGSTVVTLPGGEIFQALKLGTIDASEWVGPYNDLAFGLHRAAKFYYWPGWHEPGTTIECMINKKEFESLPNHLQKVIEVACQATTNDMLSEFSARNATALKTLVSKHKVQLKRFPDPVLKKLGEISEAVLQETGSKNPLAKKVYQSFLQFRKRSVDLGKISEEGYSLARSLTVK